LAKQSSQSSVALGGRQISSFSLASQTGITMTPCSLSHSH
jgi:hypothetical protein